MKATLKQPKRINATNRISALSRLSKSIPTNNYTDVHRRLSAPNLAMITDARQLLSNRNKPIFDARQLLSRQSSNIPNNSQIVQGDIVQIEDEDEDEEEEEGDDDEFPPNVSSAFENNRLTLETTDLLPKNKSNKLKTLQNINSAESFSFTKTIINTSFLSEDHQHKNEPISMPLHLSNNKLSTISVKSQNLKRPRSPSPTHLLPSPVIKRMQDASIRTANSSSSSSSLSSSRPPIRTNPPRHHANEHYEPTMKRNLSRTTKSEDEQQFQSATSKNSSKRISTNNSSNSTQTKQNSSIEPNSYSTTVLITNLRSSVTQNDIFDLFSEVGRIEEIKTLSPGCIQIIYLKPEYAERAVANYHNQLLDQQLIYVSLQQQQPTSEPTKSFKHSSSSSSRHSKPTTSKERSPSPSMDNNEYSTSNSKKIAIDPTFMREALFYPSNNTLNPVRFQVKL